MALQLADSITPSVADGTLPVIHVIDLSDPTSQVAKDIIGNANILTAATCIATGDTPSSVCSSSTIQTIEATLKTIKAQS